MFETRGAALKGDSLKSFLRMIQCSIPQASLLTIKSNVVIEISESRQILDMFIQRI